MKESINSLTESGIFTEEQKAKLSAKFFLEEETTAQKVVTISNDLAKNLDISPLKSIKEI